MSTEPFTSSPYFTHDLGPYYTLAEFDGFAELAMNATVMPPVFYASPDFLEWAEGDPEAGELLGFGFQPAPWPGRIAGIVTDHEGQRQLQVLPFDLLGERYLREVGDAVARSLPGGEGLAVFTDRNMACPRADRIYRRILEEENLEVSALHLSMMASVSTRHGFGGDWLVSDVPLPLPFEFAMFVSAEEGNVVVPLSWGANWWLGRREAAARKRLGEVFLGQEFVFRRFEWAEKALLD